MGERQISDEKLKELRRKVDMITGSTLTDGHKSILTAELMIELTENAGKLLLDLETERAENEKLRDELAACKAERDELQARIDGFKKWSAVLEEISSVVSNYNKLPCDPDEFAWEDLPEILSEILNRESEG